MTRIRINFFMIGFFIVVQNMCAQTTIESARSLAMSQSNSALSRGADAPNFNPANLGLNDNPNRSIKLLSFGGSFLNNSFYLKDFGKYNGEFLDSKEINQIVHKISRFGLKGHANAGLELFGVSWKNYAVTTRLNAATDVYMAKDYFDLLLKGNQLSRMYFFDKSQAVGNVMLNHTFSAGFPIKVDLFKQFAVGANLNYHKGLSFFSAEHRTGSLFTTRQGITAEGQLVTNNSNGGYGWGLDLGAVCEIKDSLYCGITLKNILDFTTWNESATEGVTHYYVNSVNVENAKTDTLYDVKNKKHFIKQIHYHQPKFFRISLARKFSRINCTADLLMIWRKYEKLSALPIIGFGAEYFYDEKYIFRGGMSLGGQVAISPSFGFGYKTRTFQWDAGVSYHDSIFFSFTKGISAAVTLYYFM